jgi:hypothetical protein
MSTKLEDENNHSLGKATSTPATKLPLVFLEVRHQSMPLLSSIALVQRACTFIYQLKIFGREYAPTRLWAVSAVAASRLPAVDQTINRW